jgi:hypothetical protein
MQISLVILQESFKCHLSQGVVPYVRLTAHDPALKRQRRSQVWEVKVIQALSGTSKNSVKSSARVRESYVDGGGGHFFRNDVADFLSLGYLERCCRHRH